MSGSRFTIRISPSLIGPIFAGLSFTFALLLRLVPQLLFPYPIGFDAPLYMSWGKVAPVPDSVFPLLPTILGWIGALNIPLALAIEIIAITLYGFLGLAIYYFSNRTLGWSPAWSFVSAVVLALSIGSLRASWDMYKELMGTIFLIFALAFAGDFRLKIRVRFVILMILAAVSHQLVLAICVATLAWMAIESRTSRANMGLFLLLAFMFSLVILSPLYGAQLGQTTKGTLGLFISGSSIIGTIETQAMASGASFLAINGFLLPLAVIGIFRNRTLTAWSLLALVGSFSNAVLFVLGASPWRWMILATYPLSLYACNGLRRLSGIRFQSLRLPLVGGSLVAMMIPAAIFIGVLPLAPFYAVPNQIPPSMVGSSIPAKDILSTQTLVPKFDAIPNATLIIVNGNAANWVKYYSTKPVVPFGGAYGVASNLTGALRDARNMNSSGYYLLYWSDSVAASYGFYPYLGEGNLKLYNYSASG